MRCCLLLWIGMLASPALAQDQSPPADKPLYRFPGLPEPRPDEVGRPDRGGPHGQLFVAPSGEPFRAPVGQPYPVATWFAGADANHNGKLDRSEFAADFERFFNVLDLNHDSVIDPAEVTHYERDVVPEVITGGGFGAGVGRGPGLGGGRRPGGGRGGFGGGARGFAEGAGGLHGGQESGDGAPKPPLGEPIAGASFFGIINIPEPIAAMDINLDGSITRVEMLAAARRRFAILDTDSRGYVTLADLPRAPAQSSGGRRRRGRDF